MHCRITDRGTRPVGMQKRQVGRQAEEEGGGGGSEAYAGREVVRMANGQANVPVWFDPV